VLVEEDPEEVLVPEPDDEAPEEVEELPLPELLEPDVEAGGVPGALTSKVLLVA